MSGFSKYGEKRGTRASDIRRKIERGDIKIEYVSRDRVTVLFPWVKKVLEAIGRPEALVTNLSKVGDFFDRDQRVDMSKTISQRLGVDVNPWDYVVDIAGKLKRNDLQ
jgi:hypothetical protein